MVLGGVPHLKPISQGVGVASNRIETEVVLDLVPQILAQACSALAAGQPRQKRRYEAVVLIRREIELFLIDAHRVPLVEQVAQLTYEVGEPVPIYLCVRPLTGLLSGRTIHTGTGQERTTDWVRTDT
jgi:hypothetical protein